MKNEFQTGKQNTWISVIKALLVIAAVAFVAYKIYDKFFKNKLLSAKAACDMPESLANTAEPEVPDTLEVSAKDVIINTESTAE